MLSPIVFSDLESDKFSQCHQLIISKDWEVSEGIFIFAPSSKWPLKFLTFDLFIPLLFFGFWSMLATKLRKYKNVTYLFFLHFAMQNGQDRKKRKENQETKMTKISKTKR